MHDTLPDLGKDMLKPYAACELCGDPVVVHARIGNWVYCADCDDVCGEVEGLTEEAAA